jgi:uncharacterized protein
VHIAKHLLVVPGADADIHARTSQGLTPLHDAARFGADSVAQLLLQRGASADVKSYIGRTPLMMATTVPVVKLLLAAGADATAADDLGMTVLQCQATSGACAGIVCPLLKVGADHTVPVSINGTSATAARLAGIKGHFALEALLSRAADDYRKQHPVASSTVGDSSSSSKQSSSVSVSSAEHSSSVHSTATNSPDRSTTGAITANTESYRAPATATAAADTASDC